MKLLTTAELAASVVPHPGALPLDRILWKRADCARFLQYTPSNMRKRVEKLPGYPSALRPGGGRPRWIAAEIVAWAIQR